MSNNPGIGADFADKHETPKAILTVLARAVGMHDLAHEVFPGARVELRTQPWRPPGLRELAIARFGNYVPDMGLHMDLDNLYGINTPAPLSHLGISDDTDSVVAGTTTLGGTHDDAPLILAFGAGAGSAPARTGATVSSSAEFTEDDFTDSADVFPVHKIALLNSSTDDADDVAPAISGIFNIIAAADPADVLINLPVFPGGFNVTLQIDHTAQRPS